VFSSSGECYREHHTPGPSQIPMYDEILCGRRQRPECPDGDGGSPSGHGGKAATVIRAAAPGQSALNGTAAETVSRPATSSQHLDRAGTIDTVSRDIRTIPERNHEPQRDFGEIRELYVYVFIYFLLRLQINLAHAFGIRLSWHSPPRSSTTL